MRRPLPGQMGPASAVAPRSQAPPRKKKKYADKLIPPSVSAALRILPNPDHSSWFTLKDAATCVGRLSTCNHSYDI